MTIAAPSQVRESTIIDGLASHGVDRRLTFLDASLQPTSIAFAELQQRAEQIAASLGGAHGVGRGERVCVLGSTSPELITAVLGIWRAGAVVTVLPVSRRADPDSMLAEVAKRVSAAHARVLLTDTATKRLVDGHVPAEVLEFGALTAPPGLRPPPPPGPDDLALLQFTSGTTSTPRAVAVRHSQIVTNTSVLFERAGVAPGDTYVTWLPLFHDMGIIMLAGALAHGLHPCVMATETFISRPAAWLQAISTYRGALTAAPNFAYGLITRYLSLNRARFDLSSLRCASNGAEPIDPMMLERFVAVAGGHGLSPTAPCPGYGLAEATLAVTMARPDEPQRTITVDRDRLEEGTVMTVQPGQPGRTLVGCGAPLPGIQVVITDDGGTPLPDGTVGSVRVDGPGVVPGYWTPDGSDHPKALRDHNGRLITGDLGFLHDEHLYLCGREKDMIIVGGRNLYPEDYEFATEHISGVRLGNVMAFSLPHSERMVVVAESRLRDSEADNLARVILETLSQGLSHAPHEVVLVKPGTLPKTTSGKRQRQVCRSLYSQRSLAVRAVAS